MLREDTLKNLKNHGRVSEEQFLGALREIFPNGHPEFMPETIKLMELHSVKNHDYASGGGALGNFERASTILSLYPGLNLGDKRVYALVLALKQWDAVLWGLANNITHKVEGLNSRLDDIAVYATIVKCMNLDIAKEQFKVAEEAADARAQEMHRKLEEQKAFQEQVQKALAQEREEIAQKLIVDRGLDREKALAIAGDIQKYIRVRAEDILKTANQLGAQAKQAKVDPGPRRLVGEDALDARPIYAGDPGEAGAVRGGYATGSSEQRSRTPEFNRTRG